ncbi:hypothetical protein LTS17_003776 [Exophiala oligosperma]
MSMCSAMLKQSISGSASPLYSFIDPEVSDFQEFISYYPTRLASALLPISKYASVSSNAIKEIWLPAAINDEVFLHVILLSSAMHYISTMNCQDVGDSKVLLKVIFDRLNRRLQTGNYSDTTIGAVSCLALCDNSEGNHTQWAMHAAGMSEMIRNRGGIASIPPEKRLKLYRGEVIGAVDTLSMPRLPRPPRSTESLYKAIKMTFPLDAILLSALVESDLTPNMFDLLIDLSLFAQTLNYAAKTGVIIDSTAYEEDITCMQYDLLTFDMTGATIVDSACRLAALAFGKSIMQETPFARTASMEISRQLQNILTTLRTECTRSDLLFWVQVMGALVSSQTDEKDWFRAHLRAFVGQRVDLVTWTNAKVLLEALFWVDCLFDVQGERLWLEVFGPA